MNEQQITTLAKNIELVVFDVDGVFTDGRIYIDNQGEETKAFNVRDGHGVRMLIHYGVQVAVISGRNSQAVNYRMKELQVTDILQGHMNKRTEQHNTRYCKTYNKQ